MRKLYTPSSSSSIFNTIIQRADDCLGACMCGDDIILNVVVIVESECRFHYEINPLSLKNIVHSYSMYTPNIPFLG